MDRFSQYSYLLSNSLFFKLVCGAGNESEEEVERLAFIYTLAGCKGFDVSANVNIVKACRRGIEKAYDFSKPYFIEKVSSFEPFVTVSVGMPGDHHVRKAFIDVDQCVNCNLCIPVCPTDAIPKSLVISDSLCIGCGNCEAVCPPAATAIRYRHNNKELQTILPQCVEAGAESIELHAGVPDELTTRSEWSIVSDCLPNGMISMCLDRAHLSNVHLMDRIKMAKEVASDRLIIQADGIPMSGGTDTFNTTLQAISIADIITKNLILKDRKFKRLPVLISGGTNSLTGELARQCNVPFSGITIGTHARSVVKNELPDVDFNVDSSCTSEAVKKAHALIMQNVSLASINS